MKLRFFSKRINLTDIESEAIKVALLDALKYSKEQRDLIDNESKEVVPIITKINRLNDLIDKLGV